MWPVEPPTGHRAIAWYLLELAGNGEQVLECGWDLESLSSVAC